VRVIYIVRVRAMYIVGNHCRNSDGDHSFVTRRELCTSLSWYFYFSIDFEMLVRFGFTNSGGEGYTVFLREAMKE